MKKYFTYLLSMVLCIGGLISCSGGCYINDNDDNGNVTKLQMITPKTVFSNPISIANAYVSVINPTESTIKNIHYTLVNQVGGASAITLNAVSLSNCVTIAPKSTCNLKLNIPAGTLAGSFAVLAANNQSNEKPTKSMPTLTSLTIGVEQMIDDNNLAGADGIVTGSYTTIIDGTPYIIVDGYVASSNAGNFNNVALVDNTGNPIPNQQIIGSVSNALGSSFSILLPTPADGSTQTIKIQTQQVSNAGIVTPVSTSTNSNTLTATKNLGIANILPTTFTMSANNPEQVITISNSGDAPITLTSLTPSSPNIQVTGFSPGELLPGATKVVGIKAIVTPPTNTNSSIVLSYDDGVNNGSISAVVFERANTSNPLPTAMSELQASASLMSLNSATPTQTITLTNVPLNGSAGSVITNLSIPDVSPPLSKTTSCRDALGVGASCSYIITYSGSSTAGSTSLQFGYNDGAAHNLITTVNIDWTATEQPATPISTLSLSSNTIQLNGSNTSQTFTITNQAAGGTAGSNITGLTFSSVTAPLSVSTNCGAILNNGSSCSYTVSYANATTDGTQTVNIGYNDGVSNQSSSFGVEWARSDVPVTPISLLSLSSNTIQLNGINTLQTVTITNQAAGGTAGSNITGLTFSSVTAPLSVSTDCGATLNNGSSCSYTVSYANATTDGTQTVNIGYNDGVSNQTTSLGVGWARSEVAVTPISALQLNSTTVSLTTSVISQTVTLTNSPAGGTVGSNITGLTFSSVTAPLSVSTDCGATLNNGSSCSYIVSYSNATADGSQTVNIGYNDGVASGQSQTLNIVWTAPIPALDVVFDQNNDFFNTTNTTVSRQVLLENGGNSIESNFVFTFPNTGTWALSAGNSNSCMISGSNTVTTSLTPTGATKRCYVTISYTNTTAVALDTKPINISYKYGTNQNATDNNDVDCRTTQASANLAVTPNPATFANIYNNNVEESSLSFTVSNSGDADTAITLISLDGDNPSFFSNANVVRAGECAVNTSLVAGTGSCTILVKFGPTLSGTVGAKSALLNVGYTSYGLNSTTVNSAIGGTVLAAQSSNISVQSIIASNTWSGGNGSNAMPYQVESGITSNFPTITLTLQNTGAVAAESFYVATTTVNPDWNITNSTCGTQANPVTLAATTGLCMITYTITSTGVDSTGSADLILSNYTIYLTDQDDPSGTTMLLSSLPSYSQQFVNVYPTPIISKSKESMTFIAGAESSESIIMSLNANTYVVNNQILSFATPLPAGITVNPTNCTVSTQNNNSSCNLAITIASTVAVGNYNLALTNSTTPNPVAIESSGLLINVAYSTEAFVSTWRTYYPNELVALPTYDGGTYDFTVNWGDGSPVQSCNAWNCANVSHTYASTGDHVVMILGTFNGVNMRRNGANPASPGRILNILQWGGVRIGNTVGNVNGVFAGAGSLESLPEAAPDLIGVSNMSYMFYDASAFNSAIDRWDVSSVTDMNSMFYNAAAFNQPLNSWSVANVTKMNHMFNNASAFNQPLNSWNVANVTDMEIMFNYASAFNQPLNSWNVANVTNMNGMFYNAIAFNQPLNSWNVANVADMGAMFYNATAFSQDLSGWNVAKVNNCTFFVLNATNMVGTNKRPKKSNIGAFAQLIGSCYRNAPSNDTFQQ